MKAEWWIRISGTEEKMGDGAGGSRGCDSVNISVSRMLRLKRLMDGMKEDVKLVGVREEGAEDTVKWRQMIGCGLS